MPTDAALASTLRIAPSTTLAPGEAATAERASAPPQELLVDATIAAPVVNREGLSATDGLQTLARVGTNEAWAKLVLMFGGWPQTDENVNVMLRWMRQENGPPDWWNRNNPLNNGYGSGGGAGPGQLPRPRHRGGVLRQEPAARVPRHRRGAAGRHIGGCDGGRHLGLAVGEQPLRQRRPLEHPPRANRAGARLRLGPLGVPPRVEW
ncbi:hypothetical protein ACRAWC_24955 [Leifsonia sp. L25]|uniref:hypothetical protein n=1 Tax=Leifsonia sp. L25 TaxID=3423957 RepID=UPI003D6955D1